MLRLSATQAIAANVETLLERLRSSTAVKAPAAATSSATGPTTGSTDIILDIDETAVDTVLEHVKALYDAATQNNMPTGIDVVLRTSRHKEDQPLVAEDLPSAFGYHLHHHVALGGTFDRLHAGHKMLLTSSVLHTKTRLRVGVTGPELLKKKKHAELLQPFESRTQIVLDFLNKQRSDVIFDVVELTEPTGGTTEIEDVTAMVCSPETLPAIDGINKTRAEKGFAPVVPLTIEYIGGDDQSRVSSTQLRQRAAAEAEKGKGGTASNQSSPKIEGKVSPLEYC